MKKKRGRREGQGCGGGGPARGGCGGRSSRACTLWVRRVEASPSASRDLNGEDKYV